MFLIAGEGLAESQLESFFICTVDEERVGSKVIIRHKTLVLVRSLSGNKFEVRIILLVFVELQNGDESN